LISESSFSEVRDERLQHSQRRFGHVLPSLLALGGIGLAATAFVFLFISERTPLFGFMEPGYGGCTDTDDGGDGTDDCTSIEPPNPASRRCHEGPQSPPRTSP
jgi:hypothetical protein